MELRRNGARVAIDGSGPLSATLRWTSAADLDLAAVYQDRDGKHGLIYFGELGRLDAFPYMALLEDVEGTDAGGAGRETLRISRIDDMKTVWILCWDYGGVQEGAPARFGDADITLTLEDEGGERHEVIPDIQGSGNVVVLAAIDNADPAGAKLVEGGGSGTLMGLTGLRDLLGIIGDAAGASVEAR